MTTILPATTDATPPDPGQNTGLDDLAAELHQRAKRAGVDPTALLDALARHTYSDRHDRPDEEQVQVDGDYSSKTRARRVSTLSAIWANDDPDLPLLGRSPWAGLSAGATTETTTGYIPLHQIGQVVDAADADSSVAGMLIRLLIWTGLRISEAANLRLTDLDDNGDGCIANVKVKGGRNPQDLAPKRDLRTPSTVA